MAVATGPSEVLPLTRRGKDGQLYFRVAPVEAQIRSLIGVPRAHLVARARIQDRESEDWLLDETLVFFIREYHRADDEGVVTPLAQVLLRRYEGWTRWRFRARGLSDDEAEEAFVNVATAAIEPIANLASDRGDFAQACFGNYWKLKLAQVHERWRRERIRPKGHVGIDESAPDEDEALQIPVTLRTDDALLGAEAIERILGAIRDPRHREAYALRHLYDWQITADDPAEPCLVRYFDVTAKTISDWLKRAEADIRAAGFAAPHTRGEA